MAWCASMLAWSYLAGRWPSQLLIELFASPHARTCTQNTTQGSDHGFCFILFTVWDQRTYGPKRPLLHSKYKNTKVYFTPYYKKRKRRKGKGSFVMLEMGTGNGNALLDSTPGKKRCVVHRNKVEFRPTKRLSQVFGTIWIHGWEEIDICINEFLNLIWQQKSCLEWTTYSKIFAN